MTPDIPPLRALPDPVLQTLRDFEKALSVRFQLHQVDSDNSERMVYMSGGTPPDEKAKSGCVSRVLNPREGPSLRLEVWGCPEGREGPLADLVTKLVGRAFEFSQEVRFFTYELSERYEEINLLYSISETLGSLLRLEDAARVILGEQWQVVPSDELLQSLRDCFGHDQVVLEYA